MRNGRLFGLFAAAVAGAFLSSIIGCGGGGGNKGGQQVSTITLTGSLDNTTVQHTAGLSSFHALTSLAFPVADAYAAGTAAAITDMAAISPDGKFAKATMSGSSFSFDLARGKSYLLVLLNNASIVGVYKADTATGMNTFPVGDGASNIDVGTVSLTAGTALGSIASAELLQVLGLTDALARDYGIMDVGMRRFSNVDVDMNGQIDYLENKSYDLGLDYEFTGGSFVSIQSAMSSTAVTYKGYEYYFWATPDTPALDWANATLTAPAFINGGVTSTECWNQPGRTLNFYCGGSATNPVTPPTGTYIVTAGTATFTFQNVTSQTIDTVNLYNIYVPLVRLTTAGGKITSVSWQWWKNTAAGWVQPTDAELATVLSSAQFEIGVNGWPADQRASGTIALTTGGSVAAPGQSFSPGAFRVSSTDKAGYHYGFEWQ